MWATGKEIFPQSNSEKWADFSMAQEEHETQGGWPRLSNPFPFHFAQPGCLSFLSLKDTIVAMIFHFNISMVPISSGGESRLFRLAFKAFTVGSQLVLSSSVPLFHLWTLVCWASACHSQTQLPWACPKHVPPSCNSGPILLHIEASLTSFWSHFSFHLLFLIKSVNRPLSLSHAWHSHYSLILLS